MGESVIEEPPYWLLGCYWYL